MSDIASKFILMGIQEWGQSKQAGTAAVQAVLDAAGFVATAGDRPVFGGIWPNKCTGRDGAAATAWLQNLTDTMPRGDFNAEARHVETAIAGRIKGMAP